jgi:outer membrane protein, heavy metal efflux system
MPIKILGHRKAFLIFAWLVTAQVTAQSNTSVSNDELIAAVNGAWERSVQSRSFAARRQEAATVLSLANTWTATAPVLAMSERSNRWTSGAGQRDLEVGLSAPLWLPSQKNARQRFAEMSMLDLDAQERTARLALAGIVRERY